MPPAVPTTPASTPAAIRNAVCGKESIDLGLQPEDASAIVPEAASI